ncbi:MAG: vanadium-dependent haloperoxidase [Saprospiraceae bacterium]|nr:vanadium-dependent haloperoxidase [Saprospiraceae bacterium]
MKKFKRGTLFFFIPFVMAAAIGLWSWRKKTTALPDEVKIILEWNRLALDIETEVEGIGVPVATRFYGYFGLIPVSIQSNIKDKTEEIQKLFPELVLPSSSSQQNIDFVLACNKAARLFISRYYINLPYRLNKKADDLETEWNKKRMHIQKGEDMEASKRLGRDIANAVYNWSATDEQGHQAYLHNFDRSYIPPVGPGKWQPDEEHPMPALLPHWGKVRTFVIKKENYLAKPLPEYTTDHSALYYSQALELFTISSPLSYENKWISEFWSDDVRGLTFTPGGRWISILCQIIEQRESSLDVTAEAFFKIGIGMADAVVACWNSKYHYNLERPESFIRKNIHDDWRSFHHSPNFPSYPSGHSSLGGVSATILAAIFGDQLDFTDNSHEGRIEFLGKPRHYNSFSEIAEENAYSRIPLGVHYRMDCQEGLRLGTEIGKKINTIKISKSPKINQAISGI